ncbi:hypothetical protein [Pseudofrankia sp. BMG5.37]|uniref:hypothetical protein n=1 Tax=Pseudofrankia sp. BMG5.37 TaxID=3050035 RepID=UPI002893BE46|nr:hypothetical protein [Pseudofrankia sp. BMG5.37]MDT3446428.1 hypothetical protein [Pseudofrankia sp. BMG5.37]
MRSSVPIRTSAAAGVLGLCLTTVACGRSSGGDPPAPATSTGETTASISATGAPLDLGAEIRTEVTAAQKRYFDAYRAAAANPRDQALVAALRAVYTDQSVSGENVRGRMAYFAEHGYVARPDARSYYVIEDITIDALPPAGRAVTVVCGYTTDPVIDGVNRAPDGKDIVVNDTPASARTRTTWIQQLDGEWKINDGVIVDSWEGENRCPPRPAAS